MLLYKGDKDITGDINNVNTQERVISIKEMEPPREMILYIGDTDIKKKLCYTMGIGDHKTEDSLQRKCRNNKNDE